MKKCLLNCALLCAMCFTVTSASAKGIIIYSNGEKIEKVQDLPEDATIDDMHVNLGVMYKQFAIFWIPMWNYGDTKYVLLNDEKDTYYDLDAEDLETVKTQFNVDCPDKPAIGFWNKIGGKMIWGALIIAAIIGFCLPDKDDKTEQTENPETSAQSSTE